MFCIKCGVKLNEDARFCYKCGVKVESMDVVSAHDETGNMPSEHTASQKSDESTHSPLTNVGQDSSQIESPNKQPAIAVGPKHFAVISIGVLAILLLMRWIIFPLFNEVLHYIELFTGPLNIPRSFSLLNIISFTFELLPHTDVIEIFFGRDTIIVIYGVSIVFVLAILSCLSGIVRFLYHLYRNKHAKMFYESYRDLVQFVVSVCVVVFVAMHLLNLYLRDNFVVEHNYISLTPTFYSTAVIAGTLRVFGCGALKWYLEIGD